MSPITVPLLSAIRPSRLRASVAAILAALCLTAAAFAQAPAAAPAPASGERCPAVTSVRFFPRAGAADKMKGGRFTGSNESATTNFQNLAEIKEAPADGQWTEVKLDKPVRYRYIKYEAPNNSAGNVAEIEFLSGTTKIAGTPFGTNGSRDNSGNDFSKALDGKTDTFFDGAEANNQYVGLDLGAAVQAASPEFAPKFGAYPAAQEVTVTCATAGTKIRISRGGTPSPTEGEEVRGPVKVDKSGILTAIAYADDLAASPAITGAYRIGEAAGDAKLVRTFHVGNSLTDTVDGWLKPVAESAGHPMDFHRFTIPGAPTDWLWQHAGSGFGDAHYEQAFFAFAPFDYLFLQPFSGHSRAVSNEVEFGGNFYEMMLKSSPQAQIWLYQQWPEQTFGEGWSQGTFGLGGDKTTWEKELKLLPGETIAEGGWQGTILKEEKKPETWQEGVANHTRYFEILRRKMQERFPDHPVRIVPAGPALVTLKAEMEAGKVPGMTDFLPTIFADGVHLKPAGRYMVSLVFYACIYKESPEGKVSALNSGLTPEQMAIFQRIAWDTVKDHPWAGMKDEGRRTKCEGQRVK
jgi:hypothetical protein